MRILTVSKNLDVRTLHNNMMVSNRNDERVLPDGLPKLRNAGYELELCTIRTKRRGLDKGVSDRNQPVKGHRTSRFAFAILAKTCSPALTVTVPTITSWVAVR